jgi:hypothetical protein
LNDAGREQTLIEVSMSLAICRAKQSLSVSIDGVPEELRGLRATLAEWLRSGGITLGALASVVLAVHETAAQAIERGAREVVVKGDIRKDAVLMSIAGGDWSVLDDLRLHLISELVSDVRVNRGIVGLRLDLSSTPETSVIAAPE